MRGHDYETGYHDVRIRRGGMCVYPRLVAARHRELADSGTVSTGIERLDGLLGGGLDRGTATFLLGPTGTGRSTVALRCAVAAAERGEKVLVHVFDERLHTLHKRARSVGLDVQSHVEAGRIVLQQTDPAEVTPGEFADSVRRHAEDGGLDLLVLDSLNAYLYAMPDEHLLHLHLHELLSYLSRQGVSSLLVATEHGAGDDVRLPEQLDVACLADTVVYFERLADGGRPKRTLTVCKRRGGEHDARRRDLDITERGIEIGEPRGAPDRVPTSDIAGPGS